jgi:hypothetical protein
MRTHLPSLLEKEHSQFLTMMKQKRMTVDEYASEVDQSVVEEEEEKKEQDSFFTAQED